MMSNLLVYNSGESETSFSESTGSISSSGIWGKSSSVNTDEGIY